MTATAKVESLIAGLLRLRGYRAVVLLEKPDRATERMFRAAVPDAEFIHLSSELGPREMEAARGEAEATLEKVPHLQKLVDLEVDGFRIGRNVLSAVVRQFRVGRLDDADPAHRDLARTTLVRSLAIKAFVEKLLKN